MGLGIGIEPCGPGAAHGFGCHGQGSEIAASALIAQHFTRRNDAVGTFDFERQRQSGHRRCALIAQHGREIDRFARAIDAALGRGKDIERTRRRAPLDASVCQIEGGAGEVEKGIITVRRFGDEQLGRPAPFAAGQARREERPSIGIGRGLAQDFIVDRNQPHRCADGGPHICQSAHKGMHAVIARNRGQAQIGDDEPLRRHLGPIFGRPILDPGSDDIGAGRHLTDGLCHGNGRGGQRVGLALCKIDFPRPDLLPDAVGNVFGAILGEVSLKDAITHGRGNRAVADAIDHHFGGFGIDRGDRQPTAQAGRHDIGIVGKAYEGRAVGYIDIEHDIAEQGLTVGGRQAGAQPDAIAPAMGQALDTDLVLFGFDRRLGRIGNHHIGREVRRTERQRIGEYGTDTRRRRLGVNHMIDHAEAVLCDHILKMGGYGVVGRKAEAEPIGGDHLAPHFAIFHAIGQRRQRVGAGLCFGPTQERIHCCRSRGQGEVVAVVTLGLPGNRLRPLEGCLGEGLPDGRVIGVDRQCLAVGDHGARLVVRRRRFITRGNEIGIGDLGWGRIGLRQLPGQAPRGVDNVLGREWQFGLADGFGRGRGRSAVDAAGSGAVELCLLAYRALEEAPFRLGIEGEGAAYFVIGAGRLAGVEIRIPDDGIVVAGQIGIGEQRDRPIEPLGSGRRQRQHDGHAQPAHLRDHLQHVALPSSTAPYGREVGAGARQDKVAAPAWCRSDRKKARIAAGLQEIAGVLFVPIDLFTALMHFLGFEPKRRNGPCIQPRDADGIAGFFAIAVGAVIEALQRRIDLGNQLALTVPRAQFQRAIAFGTGAICHVRMVLALFLKVIQRTAALAENIFLPGVELGSEIFPLARIHERLIVSGPVFNHFCNRRHQQTQLQCTPKAAYICV